VPVWEVGSAEIEYFEPAIELEESKMRLCRQQLMTVMARANL
jgi:hypothetical protein